MKKLLMNEDGTIRLANMIILVSIIFVLAIIIIVLLFGNKKNLTKDAKYVTSKTNTSKIKSECDNCSMKFISKEIFLKDNETYEMDKYLIVNNILLNKIKFSSSDKDLVDISLSKNNELLIKTGDKMGVAILEATFDHIKISVKVNVELGSVKSVRLNDSPYYAYVGKSTPLSLVTSPVGVDLSNFNISIEDESIASYVDGNIEGISVGSTNIILEYNGIVTSQTLIVSSMDIELYASINNQDIECDLLKIDEIKRKEFDVKISFGGYVNSDSIMYEFVNNGIEGNITYNGTDITKENTFTYRVNITNVKKAEDPKEEIFGEIVFKLNDGSIKKCIIK